MMRVRFPSPAPSLFLLCLVALFPLAVRAQPAGPNPAILETQCRSCHAEQFASQAASPHRVLDSEEWREQTGVRPGCISCHGDATQHIRDRGGTDNILTLRDNTAGEIGDACLDCHSSTHPEYERSPHALAGLSCNDCHQQHGGERSVASLLRVVRDQLGRLEDVGPSSAVCTGCHEDILSAFTLNERHRLREGSLECVSCHDPHEPATRSLLGGFRQEMCVDCHTDKEGPFVFEHPASRVEGCTGCHSPHGSPNRHLLNTQRVAETCIGCHAVIPQFHLGFNASAPPTFGLETQCTNCHSSIHGSNFDSHFLK